MSTFQELELAAPILKAIADRGYTTPSPIQMKAIPSAVAGRDVLGCAQTGTGKTAAFSLPVIHQIHEMKKAKAKKIGRGPRALILSPTRELATQIADSVAAYGQHVGIRYATVFGGVSQHHQVRRLRSGVDVLVATPGRLLDLMEQGHVDLRDVSIFVLDEADRMLDMGFINPIRKVASVIPTERQTLLFSATMPREIAHLADSLLSDPVRVTVKAAPATKPKISQSVFMVEHEDKVNLLTHLINDRKVDRALVFTRTKHGADKLTKRLDRSRISAASIHGNKSQNQRQRALDAFRDGKVRILVATDVAARGIDVDGVTHVFNFNLPNEPEAYVHRIGRTGRAGAEGIAVSFCARDERGFLRNIERLTKDPLNKEQMGDIPQAPVFEQDRDRDQGRDRDRREIREPRPFQSRRPAKPGGQRGRSNAANSVFGDDQDFTSDNPQGPRRNRKPNGTGPKRKPNAKRRQGTTAGGPGDTNNVGKPSGKPNARPTAKPNGKRGKKTFAKRGPKHAGNHSGTASR